MFRSCCSAAVLSLFLQVAFAGAACPSGFGSWKLCCDSGEMVMVLECGIGLMSCLTACQGGSERGGLAGRFCRAGQDLM